MILVMILVMIMIMMIIMIIIRWVFQSSLQRNTNCISGNIPLLATPCLKCLSCRHHRLSCPSMQRRGQRIASHMLCRTDAAGPSSSAWKRSAEQACCRVIVDADMITMIGLIGSPWLRGERAWTADGMLENVLSNWHGHQGRAPSVSLMECALQRSSCWWDQTKDQANRICQGWRWNQRRIWWCVTLEICCWQGTLPIPTSAQLVLGFLERPTMFVVGLFCLSFQCYSTELIP